MRVFPEGTGAARSIKSSPSSNTVRALRELATGLLDPALPSGGRTLAGAPENLIEPDGAGGFYEHLLQSFWPQYELALRRLAPDGSLDPARATPIPITGGFESKLILSADGVIGCGAQLLADPECSPHAGNGLVGRLARDGSIPPGWASPTEGVPWTSDVTCAIDVSPNSWELSAAAGRDGRDGLLVFWTVADGYDVGPGAVRAMHYTLSGPVAGVGPGTSGRLTLHGARFTREGLRVVIAGGAGAELDVSDLLGRLLASTRVPAPGAPAEILIPGTEDLPAGIYFVRARLPGAAAGTRAIVIR